MTDAVRVVLAAGILGAGLVGCGGTAPPPSAPDEDAPPPRFGLALRLEDAGVGADETPRTRVRLVRIAPDGARTVEDLGEEAGPCYPDEAAGALLAARCWWAGVGVRYRVEREGERVVGRRALEDRDEAPGPFEERGALELPEDARLELVH